MAGFSVSSGVYAGPEEPYHAALFFLFGEGTVFPGIAEIQQDVEIDFI